MGDDAELIEASLIAVAESGSDLRGPLFDRFFAAYPERRSEFLAFEASSARMADETLQMLFGLAKGEGWVWPLVAELVYEHRGYGDPDAAEYAAFVDMAIATIGQMAGEAWSPAVAEAWQRQGEALKTMLGQARAEWGALADRTTTDTGRATD